MLALDFNPLKHLPVHNVTYSCHDLHALGPTQMSEIFTFRSKMPASAESLYRFHAESGALERLTPPGEKCVFSPAPEA
jgi:hypothetical protein